MQLLGPLHVLIVVVCQLSAAAIAQTLEQSPLPSPDLVALAKQMPDCREFRNACQVCVRLADGKLGCPNIGIACNPSGTWHCAIPSQEERAR